MAMTALTLQSCVRMPLVLFLHILTSSTCVYKPIQWADSFQGSLSQYLKSALELILNWNRQRRGGGGGDNRILLIHFLHRPLSPKRRFSVGLLSGCALSVCIKAVWSGHVLLLRTV